jgi:hypothetical protein
VHEDVRTAAELARTRRVAHVAADLSDVALDGLVDRHDVERPDFVALSHEVPDEVEAEEPGAA